MNTIATFVPSEPPGSQAQIDRDWWAAPGYMYATPNVYKQGDEHWAPVEAVVYHFTGGGDAERTLKWFRMTRREIAEAYHRRGLKDPPPAPSSAHFLVGREFEDGTVPVWQLASLSQRTWHAGARSSRLVLEGEVRTGRAVNACTIGVEVINTGPLKIDEMSMLRDDSGRLYHGHAVCAGGPRWGKHRLWEPYSTGQRKALCELTARLVRRFPRLGLDPDRTLLGHDDVDGARKIDPGPVFPWREIRAAARRAA